MIPKNTWVLTHTVVLNPSERSTAIPDDTRSVPLEMWVKGRLLHDAELNSEVKILTRTGRTVEGTLIEVNPRFTHDFGEFVPELLEVGDTARAILFGEEN